RSGRSRFADPAQTARRVRLPLLLPGEAPEPAGRRRTDALLRLRVGAPGTEASAVSSGPPRRVRLGAAVLSGLLLASAFPPLDLGPLALVALAPLLWAWRDTGPRAGALYGGAADAALAWRGSGRRRERGPATLRPLAGIVAIGLVAVVGAAARPGLTPTGRLRVAVVQGNDRNRNLTLQEIRDRYLVRNHLRLARTITAPVDLVVLPESSLDADPRQDESLDAALTALAAAHHADV